MRRVPAFLFMLGLCGCAHGGLPEVKTQKVIVPAPVYCVPETMPLPPAYTDDVVTLLAAPDAAARAALVEGNWGLRNARLNTLEAIIKACKPPP